MDVPDTLGDGVTCGALVILSYFITSSMNLKHQKHKKQPKPAIIGGPEGANFQTHFWVWRKKADFIFKNFFTDHLKYIFGASSAFTDMGSNFFRRTHATSSTLCMSPVNTFKQFKKGVAFRVKSNVCFHVLPNQIQKYLSAKIIAISCRESNI